MTLATFYPFSQTDFFRLQLVDLAWPQILIFLTIALSLAMVSQIKYARLPGIGFRSLNGLMGLAINLSLIGFLIWSRDIFFFPVGITYAIYGFGRAAVIGVLLRDEDGEAEDELHPTKPLLVDSDGVTSRHEGGR